MQIKLKLIEKKRKIYNRLAKKELSVEKIDKQKKLNNNDLIYSYPEFVEAEKKKITKILKSLIKFFRISR